MAKAQRETGKDSREGEIDKEVGTDGQIQTGNRY